METLLIIIAVLLGYIALMASSILDKINRVMRTVELLEKADVRGERLEEAFANFRIDIESNQRRNEEFSNFIVDGEMRRRRKD